MCGKLRHSRMMSTALAGAGRAETSLKLSSLACCLAHSLRRLLLGDTTHTRYGCCVLPCTCTCRQASSVTASSCYVPQVASALSQRVWLERFAVTDRRKALPMLLTYVIAPTCCSDEVMAPTYCGYGDAAKAGRARSRDCGRAR
jgi:hypothetical protein